MIKLFVTSITVCVISLVTGLSHSPLVSDQMTLDPTPIARVTPTPIPRPTVSSSQNHPPTMTNDNVEHSASPLIGSIVLKVQPPLESLQSVVQWQDSQGDWHDVDGWRGSVDNGTTVWWVEEKDFETGPFRWALYEKTEGKVIAVSHSFYLPNRLQRHLTVGATIQ